MGVTFPTANGPGTDWNTPGGVKGTSLYFEANGNGNMDKAEIRTYESKVECASCHDSHSVPSGCPGSMFNPTFLRVANTGSKHCVFQPLIRCMQSSVCSYTVMAKFLPKTV